MQIVQEWIQDFNTADNDAVLAFAADNHGNVYVTGYSERVMLSVAQVEHFMGNIGTMLRKGVPTVREANELETAGLSEYDVWFMKFNQAGAMEWKQSLELGKEKLSVKLAVDANGDVILASYSQDHSACLTKFGYRGNQQWSIPIEGVTEILDMATDSEKTIFVATKHDDNLFRIQMLSPTGRFIGNIDNPGQIQAITTDPDDNLMVAGQTPQGVFVGKIEVAGAKTQEKWRRQLDAGDQEYVTDIRTDTNGNVYIIGLIDDAVLHSEIEGSKDAWLAKYNRNGNQQWFSRLTKSTGEDHATAVFVDHGGYIYVAGHTTAEVVTGHKIGERDVWLAKYKPDGSELWRHQRAITDDDTCHGLSLDDSGNIYLAGITEPQGAFPNDGWVCRLREEPETPGEIWALMRAYVVGK